MQNTPLAFERQESFSGGEDSFRRSTLIDPDQCQKLVNVIVRDNYEARTRPGFDSIIGNGEDATPFAPFQSDHPIRALFYFDVPQTLGVPTNAEQLLVAANAKLYKWTPADEETELTPAVAIADSRLAIAQGVDKVLIADGVNNMQTYDGTSFVDCGNDANGSPPQTATILLWHTGRMFASGLPGLNDTIYVSNRLAFGVGQWNNVSRSFRVGKGDGDPIVALASMQDFTLLVLKQNSIWPVITDPLNEAANFSADQDFASLSQGKGIVGRDAWCHFENDVHFWSQDGVRTVRRMAAAAGQYELTMPLSTPIQPYVDRINRNYWHLITAVNQQEFILWFVPLDNSTINNACLVWNGRLSRWIGLWMSRDAAFGEEGIETALNGQTACVTRFGGDNKLVVGDNLGFVNQWKELDDASEDSTYTDNHAGYPTKLWTRSWLFGDPVRNKSSNNTILRFSEGNALINLTLVTDSAPATNWTAMPKPFGDILGEDILPFLLATTSTITIKKGVRGLAAWNEAYLRVESDTGWFACRNITVGAFVNPMRENQAH